MVHVMIVCFGHGIVAVRAYLKESYGKGETAREKAASFVVDEDIL